MQAETRAGQRKPDLSRNARRHRKCLEEIVAYLERLGVCLASLIGSAAIIRFRGELFEAAPWLPASVGVLAFVGSIVLVVWVSADAFSRIKTRKSKIVSAAVALLVLLPSVFFVLAGFYAAMSAFTP